MSTKDDGGFAFPVIPPVDNTGHYAVGYYIPSPGMTLRDWFAGQVLAGTNFADWGTHDALAQFSYAVADAMLKERTR